jgi:hypothetical protein
LSQAVAVGGERVATAENKISSSAAGKVFFAPYNRSRFEMRD